MSKSLEQPTEQIERPTDQIVTREALVILKLRDPSTISRMVREGRLTPARKLAGAKGPYLFFRSDVQRLADERAMARAAS